MAVDNETVRLIIQSALDRAWGNTVEARMKAALQDVVQQREQSAARSKDLSWAAADHYLQNRWAINYFSPALRPIMYAITFGYDAGKAVGIVDPSGRHPVTPVSVMVTAWAVTGIEDGAFDWNAVSLVRTGRRLIAPPFPLSPAQILRIATPGTSFFAIP